MILAKKSMIYLWPDTSQGNLTLRTFKASEMGMKKR